jgi:hypothetical protein
MTFTDILPAIQSLPLADKLRLIHVLADEVAREEGIALGASQGVVPIWSQFDAAEGAATLLRVLQEETG